MGGFYRTRGSNRFGVLITFHVLTHVIDLKNPRPPRWGGSLEPAPQQMGWIVRTHVSPEPVLAAGMISGIFPRWFRRNPDTLPQTLYIKSGRGVRVPPRGARVRRVRRGSTVATRSFFSEASLTRASRGRRTYALRRGRDVHTQTRASYTYHRHDTTF